ncbi:hypothetical protein AB4259_22775, partial [Vibrio amylolyticus]|uniref:hypothetical protein n=1 Tax=Vibrio amylolyticus TaxID=2847292 RepID=UPI00354D5D43
EPEPEPSSTAVPNEFGIPSDDDWLTGEELDGPKTEAESILASEETSEDSELEDLESIDFNESSEEEPLAEPLSDEALSDLAEESAEQPQDISDAVETDFENSSEPVVSDELGDAQSEFEQPDL